MSPLTSGVMWCHSDLIFHPDTVNSIAVCLGLAKGDRKKSVLRDTTLGHNPKKGQIARAVRYFQLKGIFKGTLLLPDLKFNLRNEAHKVQPAHGAHSLR